MIFLPLDDEQRAALEGVQTIFVGADGGVAVVPKSRECEAIALLERIAGRIDALRQSEPRRDVSKRKLLKPEEVAEVLGISLANAYRIIDAHLVHVAVGEKGKRVPLSAVDAYIQRRTEAPACPTDSGKRRKAARGTARTTGPTGGDDRSASGPSTDAPHSTRSGDSKGKLTLRAVYPRTRPRSR